MPLHSDLVLRLIRIASSSSLSLFLYFYDNSEKKKYKTKNKSVGYTQRKANKFDEMIQRTMHNTHTHSASFGKFVAFGKPKCVGKRSDNLIFFSTLFFSPLSLEMHIAGRVSSEVCVQFSIFETITIA